MTRGHSAESWDAQAGAVASIKLARGGAHPVIEFKSEPYETKVIVVR